MLPIPPSFWEPETTIDLGETYVQITKASFGANFHELHLEKEK